MPAYPRSAEDHVAAGVIGADLRRLRRRRGLSKARLARLAEVDPTTVQKIEAGRTIPRVLTAVRLAAVLGVELDELLDGIQQCTSTAVRSDSQVLARS